MILVETVSWVPVRVCEQRSDHNCLSHMEILLHLPTGSPPPPLPPKPGTRLQSDSVQDTTAGYSYCIMLPAQLPLPALQTSATVSSKVPKAGIIGGDLF